MLNSTSTHFYSDCFAGEVDDANESDIDVDLDSMDDLDDASTTVRDFSHPPKFTKTTSKMHSNLLKLNYSKNQ